MESSAHASTQSHAPVALYGVMPPLVAAGGAALCVQLCSDGGGWTLASYRVDDTPPGAAAVLWEGGQTVRRSSAGVRGEGGQIARNPADQG